MKLYVETGKLNDKVALTSSANLCPDKDLKAILLLLFPDSGMLSKKRHEKIIRNPENYLKPWIKTQIDAEIKAKKHELRASARGDLKANDLPKPNNGIYIKVPDVVCVSLRHCEILTMVGSEETRTST